MCSKRQFLDICYYLAKFCRKRIKIEKNYGPEAAHVQRNLNNPLNQKYEHCVFVN